MTPGRWTRGWGQWRGWLWITGFWKVSEVQGCVHGHSSRGQGEEDRAQAAPLLSNAGRHNVNFTSCRRDLQVPTCPRTGAQLRAPSDVPPGPGFHGRVSVAECPHREAMPLETLSQDWPFSRCLHFLSGRWGSALLPESRPCSPCAPLTGTHHALVYLLKIYLEGFLFCFVSLLDTLE